jgi:hypothetical protein
VENAIHEFVEIIALTTVDEGVRVPVCGSIRNTLYRPPETGEIAEVGLIPAEWMANKAEAKRILRTSEAHSSCTAIRLSSESIGDSPVQSQFFLKTTVVFAMGITESLSLEIHPFENAFHPASAGLLNMEKHSAVF